MAPRSQETKDKISATKKRLGQRPDPSVVDLVKARKARWSKHTKDIVGTLLGIYRGSAKHRGFAFELTRIEFEVLISLPCSYCGDPPAERVINRVKLLCTGIDRVDNSKGYLVDNCVPACSKCNVAKASMSKQEYIDHCHKVSSRHHLQVRE